jgi:hypothetical protein
MSQCVFSNNIVDDRGGGLFTTGGTTTMNQTQFESNYASSGGGFFASGTKLSVFTSMLTSNSAVNGGGVYVEGSSLSTWTDCKWFANTASGKGGGAYVTGSGTLVSLVAYVFVGNTAALVTYHDVYINSGSIAISNGCPEGLHNFGIDILRCYGCQAVFPANVTTDGCEAWSPNSTVVSADQLAERVMFDRTIIVESNIFVKSEVAILGNFMPLTDLIIDGAGLWQVSGGDTARCFYVANADTEVHFRGIIVTNCRATTESFSFNYGGALFIGKYSAVVFREMKIKKSSAVSGYGSGLFVEGGATFNASDSHVFFNYGGVQGAGIYIGSGADVKLSFVMFRGNKASSSGGGCYNSGGKVQFRSCTWLSNEAQSSAGGALYLTGSASATTLMTYEFNSNSASSYNDVYKASGTLVVDNGCSEGEYTYGSGILMCYGCSLTYPANLSHTQCRPWAAEVEVQSGKELAGAVMHNSTATIITDVTVFSELAVVGYIPLTGVVFDGKGIYTIRASQDLQRRRALLATATTR